MSWSSLPRPTVSAVEHCPADPEGAPLMPRSQVQFLDAAGHPQLKVERALQDAHRAHGLMFRTGLSEDEGMLFTWPEEAKRSFWMHNTCIPLDMLFINQDGYIAGILEQVPPMNELPRQIPCKVAHVLEVRAGWCRDHGVAPGQHVQIEAETALP